MKWIVGVLLMIVLMLALFSCGQRAWTKRGYKKGWIKEEVRIDTFITDSVSKDTVFRFGVIRDTVVLKENKLTVKYFYNNNDSTVYLSGECDSDTIKVPVYITKIETKELTWWQEHKDWIFMIALFIILMLILFRR